VALDYTEALQIDHNSLFITDNPNIHKHTPTSR